MPNPSNPEWKRLLSDRVQMAFAVPTIGGNPIINYDQTSKEEVMEVLRKTVDWLYGYEQDMEDL